MLRHRDQLTFQASYLNGNHKVSSIPQEGVSIQGHNPGLVWLCHIGKDHIHHGDKHAVFVWVSGIFNHRNNVGPLLGQVDEVPARTVGELNCIDQTIRANDVRDVRDGGA